MAAIEVPETVASGAAASRVATASKVAASRTAAIVVTIAKNSLRPAAHKCTSTQQSTAAIIHKSDGYPS